MRDDKRHFNVNNKRVGESRALIIFWGKSDFVWSSAIISTLMYVLERMLVVRQWCRKAEIAWFFDNVYGMEVVETMEEMMM